MKSEGRVETRAQLLNKDGRLTSADGTLSHMPAHGEAKVCLFPIYSRFSFPTPVVGGFDSRDERLDFRFCDHMRSSGVIIIVLGIPAF